MDDIKINGKKIGINSPIFLIAEAGVNHNGQLSIAKKMVEIASNANVDAIKFQTFITENLILKDVPKVEYQKVSDYDNESFFDMVKKYEFSKQDFKILRDYCSEKKIIFLSTPFDEISVKILEELNVPAYKVGSGDMNNLPLLELICSMNKPILLSTGMATLKEVKQSVNFLKSKELSEIILFQCTTNYPTQYEDINLNVIDTYKKEFPDLLIGFSDHSLGNEASIGAAVKGVKAIEKHFTLDKKMEGPDHKASMNPQELSDWVKTIRNIEKALGSGNKEPTPSEKEIAKIARKSVISTSSLKIGDILTESNTTIKRPGTGIPPSEYYNILGKKIRKDIPKDAIIHLEDLE